MSSTSQQRVEISDQMLKHLLRKISHGKIAQLANTIGLPYGLVYNLVYGRIKSLTAENYKLIFGEYPKNHNLKRVDGSYFRQMVKLWLVFNDDVTEADLYREFYKDKSFKKVDYRLFSGATKTIDKGLESVMEEKFFDQGCTRQDIKELIHAMVSIEDQKRVPYQKMRPIVDYLSKTLQVNPSRILNQRLVRYEQGELKTVAKKVYHDALDLKKRTENAIYSGSRFNMETIREEIYGKRKGFILYSEIEEELAFLQTYGEKSVRQYLGRSISNYKKLKLKRIASWRVQKIKDACNELIDNMPELELSSLPKPQAKVRIKKLLSMLLLVAVSKITRDDDETEKQLLAPQYHDKKNYEEKKSGLISMDKTAYVLGMSKMAFDLLVAVHSDIFRMIGTYDKQWYLPYLYVRRIKEKNGFDLIKAKYEILAKDYETSTRPIKHSTSDVHISEASDCPQEEDAIQTAATVSVMSCLPPELCCSLN